MIRALSRVRRAAIAAGCALALAACQLAPVAPPPAVAPTPPATTGGAVYTPVAFQELPGWTADAQEAAWPAFLVGCRALQGAPEPRALWGGACADAASLATPDTATARAFFETHFKAYRLTDAGGADSGLVTGYY